MIYLKSGLVGLLVAVLATIVWPVLVLLFTFQFIAATGSGGLGAVSVGLSDSLLPAILGFALGFFFTYRRQRRRVRPV